MKKIKLLLFIGGLFWLSGMNAQGVNLRLDSNSLFYLPGVVNLNSIIRDTVVIYNDSSTAFSGLITIAANINGDSLVADTAPTSILYYPTANQIESIPSGQHIVRELVITVGNPPFIIGTSGVVIWPISLGHSNPFVHISDSLSKTITVLHPVGIDEMVERNLKVYMNNQQLIIKNEGNYLLKSLKLYDVSGKLLNEQEVSKSGILNMNEYATGIYLAEVNFADNTRMIFKVFNTH